MVLNCIQEVYNNCFVETVDLHYKVIQISTQERFIDVSENAGSEKMHIWPEVTFYHGKYSDDWHLRRKFRKSPVTPHQKEAWNPNIREAETRRLNVHGQCGIPS